MPNAMRAPRSQIADLARADDAERFAVEFGADKLLPVPVAFLVSRIGRGNESRQRKHQANGNLGNTDGILIGRGRDHDAGLLGMLHIDIVQAHAGAADRRRRFCRSRQ